MKSLATVLVTGLSGSGKSTVLHTLEDMGYFCIDNLPSPLVGDLVSMPRVKKYRKLAVAMDAREEEFLRHPENALQQLARASANFDILFLEAESKMIGRRYRLTRRRHPLSGYGSLSKSIVAERKFLRPLRAKADKIIDTTHFAPRDLAQTVKNYFAEPKNIPPLEVTLLSFGFQQGIPEAADLVMDVRFLPNPNFVPRLARFSGKNQAVRKYVLSLRETQAFLKKWLPLLGFLIPQYQREGRSYLTIAIGCTGGRHRSVAIAEELYKRLAGQGHKRYVRHRELND